MKCTRSLRSVSAIAVAVLFAAASPLSARAEIRMPNVFGSHMVLQQEKPVIIWGWASPNETVTIQLASETRTVQANKRGEWKAVLPALKAGGPHILKVAGSNTVQLDDILVGEVWLCSGQSNMEMGIGISRDGKEEIAAANHPAIRLLMEPNRWSAMPETNFVGAW